MTDWIAWKWTPEKPYPETLETRFEMVKFADGETCGDFIGCKQWYYSEPSAFHPSAGKDMITHYRIASEDKE